MRPGLLPALAERRQETGPACPEAGCQLAVRPVDDGKVWHPGLHFTTWVDPADRRPRYSWWGLGRPMTQRCDLDAVKEAAIGILIRKYTGGSATELVAS